MTSRIDRRTVLAAGLLIAFAVLTALPWRNHDTLKPSFDPTSNAVLHQHTSAWSGSLWWQACAVLGLIAALSAAITHRLSARFGVVAVLLALSSWAAGSWQLHHYSRPIGATRTIAIANFTAGPHIGLFADSQLFWSYLAGVLLAGILVVLLFSAGNVEFLDVISRSRARLIIGAVLLVVVTVLSLLPWYTYVAFSLRTTNEYVAKRNAWTTFNTADYWRAAIVLGVIAAVALLLRARLALWFGAIAAAVSIGCWIAGTWQLHQPVRATTSLTNYAINSQRITSIGSQGSTVVVNHFVSAPVGSVGQTLISFVSLVVLIALLVVPAVALARRDRPAESAS